MSQPFIVLGTYHPDRWNAAKVGNDLCRLTAQKGLKPHNDPTHGAQTWCPWFSEARHAEVKRRTTKSRQGEDWHYDGDTTPGSNSNCAIVLWSSNTPTQFRDSAGNTYTPRPYEVVLFRNRGCSHRRPPGCPRIRWTFRQRVSIPNHLQLP